MTRREKYRLYMTSEKWKLRRIQYYKKHKKKCRACDALKRIELHHKTYKRLGSERDQDLVPLCHCCHSGIHKIHNKDKTQSLWRITEQYIRDIEDGIIKKPKPPSRTKTRKKKKSAKRYRRRR